jgi:hypothetical protein
MMRNGPEEGRRPKDGNEAQEQVDGRSLDESPTFSIK